MSKHRSPRTRTYVQERRATTLRASDLVSNLKIGDRYIVDRFDRVASRLITTHEETGDVAYFLVAPSALFFKHYQPRHAHPYDFKKDTP